MRPWKGCYQVDGAERGAVAFTPQGLPPGPRLVWSTPPNTMLVAPLPCPLGFARQSSFVVCREHLCCLHSYHPPEKYSPHFFQRRKQSSEGVSDLPKITQLFDSTHRDAFPTIIPTFCGRKREEGGSRKTDCKTSKQSLLSRS